MECGIDKVVEEAIGSEKAVRFIGERYAQRQESYFNAVEHALKLPIYKTSLPAHFVDLHNEGLWVISAASIWNMMGLTTFIFHSHILKDKSGWLPPEKPIFVPNSMEQLVRPRNADTSELLLQSSSANAVPQMHVHEYMTGDFSTGSFMVVCSKADAGPVYTDPEYYETEDQCDITDMPWSGPSGGYSFFWVYCIWQHEDVSMVSLKSRSMN